MKTSRIILAAFAAALALVSCTKETADRKTEAPSDEVRTFTVEFSKPTRTTLSADGITPVWQGGDKIWISNSESGEEVEVSVSGNTATISTELSGKLTAVYPSSAAVKNGNDVITGFSVPATQHGTFAESNICMVENISVDAETITFENQTAILKFYVDESIGVSQIEIDGTGVATGGNKITVTPSSGTTLYNVGRGSDARICYAAVLPVSGTNITLTSTTTTQSTVSRPISSATLAANTIYNAFIPYYIEVNLGEKGTQKWGYCNVGAFLPEEYGLYFAWGETTGHVAATNGDNAFTFGTGSVGFSWSNCPHSDGQYNSFSHKNSFTKYIPSAKSAYWGGTGTADGKTTLESSDDAATVNWGSGWRMPTKDEFDTLAGAQQSWDSSNKGWTFGTPSIFLPAAGVGDGTNLLGADSGGDYWSSSLITDSPNNAYGLYFSSSNVKSNASEYRYIGYSVRPLSE